MTDAQRAATVCKSGNDLAASQAKVTTVVAEWSACITSVGALK